jgi:hypothetical protein
MSETLPTGLAGLSAEQREALAARQQQEMGQGKAQMVALVNSLSGAHKTLRIAVYALALYAGCYVACAVFLYRKFADGIDVSYELILSPLMAQSCLQFVAAIYTLCFLRKQRQQETNLPGHLPAVGVEQEQVEQQKDQAQHETVLSMISSLCKLSFFLLLLDKLTTDPAMHFIKAILVPYWAYLGMASAWKVMTRGKAAVDIGTELQPQQMMVRITPGTVVVNEIFANGLTFGLVYMIGDKLDSIEAVADANLEFRTWVATFGIAFFFLACGFCACCSATIVAPRFMDEGQPGGAIIVGMCCWLLPSLILMTVFLAFLAHDLDGTADHSNETIFGVLIAFEVFFNLGIILAMLGLEAFLAHFERAMAIQAGMEDHRRDQDTLNQESAVARDKLENSTGAKLKETHKRVKLVRETSTLFRRMASGAIINTSPNISTPSAATASSDDTPAPKVCAICMENPRDAVLQPCGHGGICFECGKIMAARRSKCPLCRAAITEVLHIVGSGTTDVVSSDMSAAPSAV